MSRGVVYMGLAVFFFSLMNLGVKLLPGIPVFELILFRSSIAALIAYSALRAQGIPARGKRVDLLLLRGGFGFAALVLFFLTLQELPLASAVTIQYLNPLFVAILGIFLLGERMSPLQWLWFFLSTAGIVMIKGFDYRVSILLLAVGVLSALFSGLAYTMVRKLKDSDHPLVVTLYFPLVTIPLSGAATAFNWVPPAGYDWLIILGMGITAQLGQLFMTKSLHLEKANIVISMHYTGIIYGLLFGYFLFGEVYSWQSLCGILLVLTGIAFNIFLPQKKAG